MAPPEPDLPLTRLWTRPYTFLFYKQFNLVHKDQINKEAKTVSTSPAAAKGPKSPKGPKCPVQSVYGFWIRNRNYGLG